MSVIRTVAKVAKRAGLVRPTQPGGAAAPAAVDLSKLPPQFDYVDYVFSNPDLADKFRAEPSAAEHYLRHGIPEGRRLFSGQIDYRFVRKLYGVSLSRSLDIPAAARAVSAETGARRFYPTLTHALRFNGLLNNDFLSLFDQDYYYATNKLAADLGTNPNRDQCLVHFCEIGVNLALPFSAEHTLDFAFYNGADANGHRLDNPIGEPIWTGSDRVATVYPRKTLAERTADALARSRMLRHWLNVGLPSQLPGNLRDWITRQFKVPLTDIRHLNLERYKALNPDLAAIHDERTLVEHLLTIGIEEQRPGAEPTAETAELFVALAEQASGREDQATAGRIFDAVLYRVPGCLMALHPAGDNLLKLQHYRAAVELYRGSIASGAAGPWSYLNLSTAYRGLKDSEAAFLSLTEAASAFSDDVQMQVQAQAATKAYFDEAFERARAIAQGGELAAAQADVKRLCQAITPDESVPADRRPIRRVAIVANCDLYQCRVYRVDQKYEQLVAAGFETEVFEQHAETEAFIARLHEFDAVIFYRVPALPNLVRAIVKANEAGLVTIYDIDDLIFDGRLYPEAFETYGGLITRAEYAGLALGVPLFAHAMRLCEYGMASTPSLAEHMRGVVRSGQVFLHRNGFGSLHERYTGPLARPTPSDVVTIFYGSGTKAHKEDFREVVEPAFRKLYQRHGSKIAIFIVGYNPMSEMSADMAGIVTVLPPIWDLDAFWSVLRDADINVAVVNRNPVTDAKSEIKWLEAALFGIPSVVSRTTTYEEVVEDGRTGFLCDNADDFYRQLDRLVRDRDLRRQVGQAARAAALSQYNLHTLSENLRGTLASLSPARAVRPKIVIVNVFYPPQAYGGATRVVYDNVTDLKSRYGDRFDIEVFTTLEGGADPYKVRSYVEGGVRVTCVTTPDDPDINHRTTSSPMAKIFSEFLAETRPQLVHFHCIQRLTVSIVEATAKAGVPYVITAHDGWWISDRQFLVDEDGDIELYDYANGRRVALEIGGGALSRQSALKPALFGASKVLAVSEPFANIYRQAQVPNVIAIPNGVSKLPSGRRSMSASGRVRLGHVGGTERHKGLFLVKTALLSESFSNLELTVVDYAKPLGYSAIEIWGTTPIRVIARLPQSRVSELYENIDVHLACSIWPESYGLVTRESAAFGCWIVASDAGAVAEPVIEGQNGHVVRHGELEDLVRVFRQIDGDPDKYRGPTLRQPPIRRSYEQAEELAKIYVQLIRESGEARPEAADLPLQNGSSLGPADGNAVAAE